MQILPTAQATPGLTDSFSRGYDPYTHRPLTTVGWSSLSVIVIVIEVTTKLFSCVPLVSLVATNEGVNCLAHLVLFKIHQNYMLSTVTRHCTVYVQTQLLSVP